MKNLGTAVASSLTLLIAFCCTTPEHQIYNADRRSAALARSRTMLFIHGLYSNPLVWKEWKAYFERQGYQVRTPAWPLHDGDPAIARKNHPDAALGKLGLNDVVDVYRRIIKGLPEAPILVGHSMGGLITQILLEEKLGVAGIVIHSAPSNGKISMRFSFLRSNWPVVTPFADDSTPILLKPDQFHYAFTNCMENDEALAAYAYHQPESRVLGKGALSELAQIDFGNKTQPLLFIAGGLDHIIPDSLNYANFQEYKEAPSLTEFKNFPNRCHWTLGQRDWQQVAGYIQDWMKRAAAVP